MRHEDLGRCFVAQALSWQRIQVMGEVDKVLLGDVGQIRIARHEASNTLVGVLDRTFLPRRIGIAEPASGTDPIFQSPESGELCAAIKGEASACKDGSGEKASMILSMIGRECRLRFLIITV